MIGNSSHFMFVVSSAEVWKFWSKLRISRRSAWQRRIMPGIKGWIKACCMRTLKVSIFWWKLHTPMQILPSNTENFPLTVNLTTELLFPCDRYSSVKSDYTLPQSFSHAPRLANAVGESYVNKNIIKARTCEDQTQEYNTINITRILWALYGPAALFLSPLNNILCRIPAPSMLVIDWAFRECSFHTQSLYHHLSLMNKQVSLELSTVFCCSCPHLLETWWWH